MEKLRDIEIIQVNESVNRSKTQKSTFFKKPRTEKKSITQRFGNEKTTEDFFNKNILFDLVDTESLSSSAISNIKFYLESLNTEESVRILRELENNSKEFGLFKGQAQPILTPTNDRKRIGLFENEDNLARLTEGLKKEVYKFYEESKDNEELDQAAESHDWEPFYELKRETKATMFDIVDSYCVCVDKLIREKPNMFEACYYYINSIIKYYSKYFKGRNDRRKMVMRCVDFLVKTGIKEETNQLRLFFGGLFYVFKTNGYPVEDTFEMLSKFNEEQKVLFMEQIVVMLSYYDKEEQIALIQEFKKKEAFLANYDIFTKLFTDINSD